MAPEGAHRISEGTAAMTVTLHNVSVPVFTQGLSALGKVLAKAETHAAAKNIDPAALIQARLYPDMFPFAKQVNLACEFAKGAVARLAGEEVPAWDDPEPTFEALKARVEKTLAYLAAAQAGSIDGQEARDIILVRRGVESVVKAQAYLLEQAQPNFYFHLTTAYAILRHNGVEIGKKDFLGAA
jgi:uncharacterized protein